MYGLSLHLLTWGIFVLSGFREANFYSFGLFFGTAVLCVPLCKFAYLWHSHVYSGISIKPQGIEHLVCHVGLFLVSVQTACSVLPAFC